MKEIRMLYGFSSESIAGSIEKAIQSRGYKVVSSMRPTKQMLKEFIESHPETQAVVLKEYLDGGGRYGIDELLDLADNVNTNFVFILSTSFRGKDAMKELYAAGILNAVFSDDKKGVKPDILADLIINGRTRAQARAYYHIDRKIIKKKCLTIDEYDEMYKYLASKDEGLNLMERFVTVSRWVSPEQLALFIKALPEDACNALKRYKEFYDINNRLFKLSLVGERLKCPKDAVDGIPPEALHKASVEKKNKGRVRDIAKATPAREQTSVYEEVIRSESGPKGQPVVGEGQDMAMQTDFHKYISEHRKAGTLPMGYEQVPSVQAPSMQPQPQMMTGDPMQAVPPVYAPQMAPVQSGQPPVQTVPASASMVSNTAPVVETQDAPSDDLMNMDVKSLLQMMG